MVSVTDAYGRNLGYLDQLYIYYIVIVYDVDVAEYFFVLHLIFENILGA
jgi:hypothetical protein